MSETKVGTVHYRRRVGENTGRIMFIAHDGLGDHGFVTQGIEGDPAYGIVPEWHASTSIGHDYWSSWFHTATEALATLAKQLGGSAYEIEENNHG